MKTYEAWFEEISGHAPHPWQAELGRAVAPMDRLLRVPTGFGKTGGTALAWLYHRCVRGDQAWPLRLVFCLPMRVLVEQTEQTLKVWIKNAGLDVNVVVLLGGREAIRWLDDLDKPTIIVGTQDMLLSRALNRGYASARALWPMELGALHSDALWVVDEVQLMDTGLATTTQLAAFRARDREAGRPAYRPVFTWWMSATLQPKWLETIDFRPRVADLPRTRIEASARVSGLWEVRKELHYREDLRDPAELAKLALELHEPGSLSLVIVNTVDRANKVAEALVPKKKKGDAPDVRLVHSRFRGHERRSWTFLTREASSSEGLPPAGRIIVATQVVEAGVDMSARLLITDLAPWSSLVQRFGRCARYSGEAGKVFVVGAVPAKEADARPYELDALKGAATSLVAMAKGEQDVGPRAIEAFEEALEPDSLDALYPYAPEHVLRRPDFDELFDTSPDLAGADLDVGRYIRTGEDRDVSVFWRKLDGTPDSLVDTPWPARDEICPVPAHQFQELADKETKAFVFDYVRSAWRERERYERVVPGMTFLLPTSAGGYSLDRGWDSKAKAPVPVVEVDLARTNKREQRMLEASLAGDDDALAMAEGWKTIRLHGHEAREQVDELARAFALPDRITTLLGLAARWHDVGKAHEVFQGAIRGASRDASPEFGPRRDLAKAPQGSFARPPYRGRPGFRHELASALMLFEVLRRKNPDHPALLGPHREVLTLLGTPPRELDANERIVEHPLADELAALSSEEVDLVAYLVAAHHGKVRGRLASSPRDIESAHGDIHGVRNDDVVPSLEVAGADGTGHSIPATKLDLSLASLGLGRSYGASWTDRVQGLLHRYGPFSLAFLETLLRLADWRASSLPQEVLP